MFRALIIILYLAAVFVVSLPLYVIIPLIAKFNQSKADHMSQGFFCRALHRIAVISGVKLTVYGKENIPTDEASLFIGNHQSYYDIITTYPEMIGLTGYIAKKEVDRVWLLKYWMRLGHCLTFDRDDPRNAMRMIKTAIEQIKAGYSMFVFPEGTRSKDGIMGEFKEGTFKIATRTNCPIVPVAIRGTADVFEKHVPFVRPAHVTVAFGTPIRASEVPDEYRKHIGEYMKGRISEMLQQEQ